MAVVARRRANYFPAECETGDTVGALVYARQDKVDGRYVVGTCDPADRARMPAIGIIVSKSGPTQCTIAISGLVSGVLTGLVRGSSYFVGNGGSPTTSVPVPPTTKWVQTVGLGLSGEDFLLSPSAVVTRRSGL